MPEGLSKIIENFSTITDPELRSMLLVDYAEKFQEVPERISKRPFPKSHEVPYCESETYVWTELLEDDRVKLHFAVENPSGISAKALAVIIDKSLSGQKLSEFDHLSPDLVYAIFGRNIGMGKGRGLISIIELIKYQVRKLSQQDS